MEPQITDFLGIAIVGATLSLVIQIIKNRYGTTTSATKLLTIGLSVLLGAGYYLLRDTVLYENIVGILGVASIVYGLLIKK